MPVAAVEEMPQEALGEELQMLEAELSMFGEAAEAPLAGVATPPAGAGATDNEGA